MTKARTGSHDICRATSFSIPAPNNNIIKNNPAKIHAVFIDIVPLDKCLEAVLGFAASISLSIIRFSVIARPRAPTPATKIQTRSRLKIELSSSKSLN